jgi:hypothetical protein
MAFDCQKFLIESNVTKGPAATLADCGLGKSLIELAYAQNVVEHTNGNMLLLTPLAVGSQMLTEAEKFGIEAHRSRDGKVKGKITISNYEQLEKFDPDDFVGVICDEYGILKTSMENQTGNNAIYQKEKIPNARNRDAAPMIL